MAFKIQITVRQGQQTCLNAQIDFRNDEKKNLSQIRELLLQQHVAAAFYFHFDFVHYDVERRDHFNTTLKRQLTTNSASGGKQFIYSLWPRGTRDETIKPEKYTQEEDGMKKTHSEVKVNEFKAHVFTTASV